jgi:cytochrome c556
MKALLRIALLLWLIGFALAAQAAHNHTMSPDMKKQHDSMLTAQKQWLACKKSLEAGSYTAAGDSLSRVQKAVIDLDKFKPHKNSDMMKNFKEQADNFKNNLSELGKAIREKNMARTQSISMTIDNSCLQCHSIFR